jgi:hypothetical protein
LRYGGVSSEIVLPTNAMRHKHWEKDHASSHPIFTCTGPAIDFSYAGVSSNVQYAGRPARAACRDKSDVGKDILGNVATTLALYSLS